MRTTVELAAALFEAAGTFVMTVGAVVALVLTLRDRANRGVFKVFRYRLGRAIILGLELLVAADILRTISTAPTLNEVAILGGIVLIRGGAVSSRPGLAFPSPSRVWESEPEVR